MTQRWKPVSFVIVLGAVNCNIYGPHLLEPGTPNAAGSGGTGGALPTGGGGTDSGGTDSGGTDSGGTDSGGTDPGAALGDAGEAGASQAGGGANVAGTGGGRNAPYVTGVTKVPQIMTNLGVKGSRDWAHWGLKTVGDFNHKSGVRSEVLDFKPLGAVSPTLMVGGLITYSWNGGTPVANATTSNGLTWVGVDQGFQLVTSAADEQRRINLYIGVIAGSVDIRASVSDPAAVSHVEDRLSGEIGAWNLQELSIDYGFAAAGSKLTVTLKAIDALDATAAISLHGVTFEGP